MINYITGFFYDISPIDSKPFWGQWDLQASFQMRAIHFWFRSLSLSIHFWKLFRANERYSYIHKKNLQRSHFRGRRKYFKYKQCRYFKENFWNSLSDRFIAQSSIYLKIIVSYSGADIMMGYEGQLGALKVWLNDTFTQEHNPNEFSFQVYTFPTY